MSEKKRPRTYYYKIWVDDSDPLAMICIGKDDKGFNEYRFYRGEWIEDWPEGITFFVEGQHSEDYLLGGLHWMVFSEQVRQAFEQCRVEGVQFLPVRVVHKETGEEIGPYWAFNVVRLVEALDWERTRWSHPEQKYDNEYPILDIIKETLCAEPLTGIDSFRLKVKGHTGQAYISPRLKRCLERERATRGFEFIKVPVY